MEGERDRETEREKVGREVEKERMRETGGYERDSLYAFEAITINRVLLCYICNHVLNLKQYTCTPFAL